MCVCRGWPPFVKEDLRLFPPLFFRRGSIADHLFKNSPRCRRPGIFPPSLIQTSPSSSFFFSLLGAYFSMMNLSGDPFSWLSLLLSDQVAPDCSHESPQAAPPPFFSFFFFSLLDQMIPLPFRQQLRNTHLSAATITLGLSFPVLALTCR